MPHAARTRIRKKREDNGMTVIDTHTHFFPGEWVRLLERELILGKTAARLLKL